ncbi:MAG: S4 domain-containing protein, partial [Brevundimonas sp.]
MTRLDVLLVSRALVPSRAQARAAIEAGGVTVDGQVETSASRNVADDAVMTVEAAHDYVGRGALKLAQALDLWD